VSGCRFMVWPACFIAGVTALRRGPRAVGHGSPGTSLARDASTTLVSGPTAVVADLLSPPKGATPTQVVAQPSEGNCRAKSRGDSWATGPATGAAVSGQTSRAQ